MTAFDPAVTYRILAAKRDRIQNEGWEFFRRKIWAEMDGHWYDQVFYDLDAKYRAKMDEADGLMDVLMWLQEQIEARRTREERIWDFIKDWEWEFGPKLVENVLYAADIIDGKRTF